MKQSFQGQIKQDKMPEWERNKLHMCFLKPNTITSESKSSKRIPEEKETAGCGRKTRFYLVFNQSRYH
jgi:hypothetical protein